MLRMRLHGGAVSDLKDMSQPIKHVNGLGEVMWQPAIEGGVELRYGHIGEMWTRNRGYGKPVLYYTHWWAKRRGIKRAAAEARAKWERAE